MFGRPAEGIVTPAPVEPTAEAVAGPEDDIAVQPSAIPAVTHSEALAVPQSDSAADEARPSRRQAEPATGQPDRPREYIATVVAIRERARGQMVITLDNGESWSEQYASRGFLVEVGDSVTMKKGLLSSSYRLIAPGGRSYKMTRIDQ
jgi:hypothetical protein